MPASRIHETVAKKVNQDYLMNEVLLRIGTIAPDCWRNVDSKSGMRSKEISHLWDYRKKNEEANDYVHFYLKYYDEMDNPFYFGYLIHLMVDQYWKSVIDPKYFFEEDGIGKCRLRDGTTKESKDNYFAFFEDQKIERRLAKDYNLGLLSMNMGDYPELKCNIDEIDLSGLFGPNGTISFVNDRYMPGEDIEESKLYDYSDIERYIDDTVTFVKSELKRLKEIKEQDDKKIKIAVDIDDTLLCTEEKRKECWQKFLANHPEINPVQEHTWENPVLAVFWDEYRGEIAFGDVKEGSQETLNDFLSNGYRVDLISARALNKYSSYKKKMVEYFENNNINYSYINLGFRSKKDFLRKHNFDILIDNELRNVEEANEVGIATILFGPYNPDYNGLQTDDWSNIPMLVEEIIKGKNKSIK